MKSSTFALLSVVGSAAAQAVTSAIAPSASAPAGCEASYNGPFEIGIKGKMSKRAACSGDGILVATLANGVVTDAKSRTGYIASNYQFQFDAPPQAGAIYTAGFSACPNGSLALGDSTIWYECLSGDFYNLYSDNWAAQCSPVEIEMVSCSSGSDPSGEGQIVGTEVITTTVVVPLSDGQPQVITTTLPVPICQITDGQLQVHTTPCASVTFAASASITPVSQYSDGQIQVTPAGSAIAAPAPETTPAGESATGESASATVVLPSETMPASNSTLLTTASPTVSGGSSGSATASGSAATSAPAVGSAGRVEMGSLAALAVGVLAAAWGL